MPKLSAGILLFRRGSAGLEVMLVHPGGPFWAKKDEGAWSIPKGLAEEGEDLLAAAKREFLEETGMPVDGAFLDLGAHKQASGKTIVAWACEGEFDPASLKSNTFSLEWPPRSGRMAEFPEVDRAAWYSIDEAFVKINKGQKPILAALEGFEGWVRRPTQLKTERRICGLPSASRHETRAARLFVKRTRTWRSGWTSPPLS